MVKLKSALAGYEAQYSTSSLADQHKCLPPGAIQRVESVVDASKEAQRVLEEVRGIANQVVLGIYDGDAASDILDVIAEA
jgi:hypothetical protein